MKGHPFPNPMRDTLARKAWPHVVGTAFALAASTMLTTTIRAEISTPGGAASAPIRETRELLDVFCYDCHGEGTHKGDMALDKLLEEAPSTDRARHWEKVWKIIRHEFMPPADAERPSDAERRKITQWIEEKMLGVDRANPDPGRVTIRRLNRMEYEFTITDLFGSDLTSEEKYSGDSALLNKRLRDRLPPDDTAFGFDNIGDFQSLSPALLEKYFDIAEFVVDRVVSVDGPTHAERGVDTAGIKTVKAEIEKRAEQVVEFNVTTAGKYRVDVQFTLGGWFDYGGAYDFSLKVDDEQFFNEVIEVGGQHTHQFTPEKQLEPGTHRVVFSTLAKKADSKGKLNYLELRPRIRLIGPVDIAPTVFPEAHRRIFTRGEAPADPAAREAYAREIVRRVADRAFRRPTDEGTIDRLTAVVMRNEQFERGVREAFSAILTSPRFLFRAELQPQPNDPKSIHPLDEFALASRLSYFLWLSLPDEELRTLASEGKLRTNLEPQVRRMLADPKSARFFEDFPGQWLRTRNVLMTPITKRDEEINALRGAMKRETEMLFEHIARNDRDLLELVTADYTFVDRPLADFYKLKGYEGEGFQKVSLSKESRRGGILTQGSFLISTSNPNRTSPVKRGLFVLENLFATQVPPPPANIPPLDDAKSGGVTPKTVKEQLELHRADKSCAACHAHFDPIGVVLENYDLVGNWREKENGEPIVPNETTVTGETLTGMDDLRALFVARKGKFYECVTEKLLTYALGRGMEPSDTPVMDEISDQLAASGGKFSTLLMAVINSPSFQLRRGDDGSAKEAPKIVLPKIPPPELRKGPRRRFRPEEFQRQRPADAEAKAAQQAAGATAPDTATIPKEPKQP